MISFYVEGEPAPQGSKSFKGMRRGARGQQVPILTESSAKVKPWRDAVAAAALLAMAGRPLVEVKRGKKVKAKRVLIAGPVNLYVGFCFARPAKPMFARYPATQPDLDKLIRATMDALTIAGVWEDDSRVVGVRAKKEWGLAPGAWIEVEHAG